MSAFEIAISIIFRDKNLTKRALYINKHGEKKEVNVITNSPDLYQKIEEAVIYTPSLMLEVQVDACPNLEQGDKFIIDGKVYTVQGEPRRGAERLTWSVDLHETRSCNIW